MPVTPGSRLGPYEVSAQIGVGGMGEVYRGRDTILGRQVAIKVLLRWIAARTCGRLFTPAGAAAPPLTVVVNWLSLMPN